MVEFFKYSINSILYQRGLYPPKKFTPCKHYNLQMMLTTDNELQTYLNNVLTQLQNWLLNGQVNRLVLVIASQNNPNNILERWQFNIITEKVEWQQQNSNNSNNNSNNNNNNNENNRNAANMYNFEMKSNDFGNNNNNNNGNNNNGSKNTRNKVLKNAKNGKSLKEIQREIQAIMRQITSSVTFLPLLDGPCSFDLLVYTDKKCNIPRQWEQSDPKFVNNSENVKLRSFTTRVTINTKQQQKKKQKQH